MAGSSKEYKLAIKIAGEIEKSFYESTKMTKKELRRIAREAAKSSDSIAKQFRDSLQNSTPVFEGLEKTAKTTFKAVAAAAAVAGAGIAAGIGASVSAGSEFESAFAGVKKTVNATSGELEQMRDDLRSMSKEMPQTAAELSGIAEAAGQLGIHTENITGFTKTMADLSVATNLSQEEGAAEFAKFANIVGMEQDNFDRLGSTVVALGNNMATTEADTVEMAMRLAAAGDQVRLSESQIMGYAAALSSVGIEAEAGGSAFSKLLVNMQLAAETGKDLKEYAGVAGMTGEEFKKAFREDAAGAINAFLSGLKDAEKNGKSAIAVLNEMGIKETRLRDTLLRAANASGLFDDALKTSSDAWEENTALANEAAQRYATFESQCDILKNKTADIGISVYDAMKPGLTGVIGLANDFIDSIAGQEDALGNMIEETVSKLPTMVRQTKSAAKAVKDFSAPFLSVGKWLVDNPGVIVGTITGIGTALATYKIAMGVSSLAAALGTLGPAGWTVLGIGGVAAVISGIGTAVKKSAAEAKKANLDRHFGNISLSMKDIQSVASHIVNSKSLEKVRKSLSAMSELDGISGQVQDAAEALNKMNWKVSIGMELTDQEKQDYQDQLQSFLTSTQEYVTQDQYAVSLSIGTLVQDDLERSNIISQVNRFYENKQGELESLGKQLNETITEAFKDGLLDIDEAEEISKLQQQIAHIKSSLAESNFEAGMKLIETKYSGQQLDADSFQNLQAEMQVQTNELMSGYEDEFKAAMSRYAGMRSEGAMTQEELLRAEDSTKEGYLQEKANLQVEQSQFQMNMIRQSYGELDGLISQLQTETQEELGRMLSNVANGSAPNMHLDMIPSNIVDEMKGKIDKPTRDALGDLYKQMEPLLEQMENIADQYRAAGKEVPDALQESIGELSALGGLSGNADALWGLIGKSVKSEEYTQMIKEIQGGGGYIPEQIADAIEDNQEVIGTAVKNSCIYTQQMINKTFGESTFDIPLNIKPEIAKAAYPNDYLKRGVKEGHADGGIFNIPHVAWFAEKGPEAAIPLDGSQNAISLWEKTGELLGMEGITGGSESLAAGVEGAAYSGGNSQEIRFDYNPTLQFYGDSPSRGDITAALEDDQEKFERQMNTWMRNNARLKFY